MPVFYQFRQLIYSSLLLLFVLLSACSEDRPSSSSKLNTFSDHDFQTLARSFAETLFAKDYVAAYGYLSSNVQKTMTVQTLKSDYEALLAESELTNFKLEQKNNYDLMYERDYGVATVGIASRPKSFSAVTAMIIINGHFISEEGDDSDNLWTTYTAYYIDFSVENNQLKIGDINFMGHH